MAGESRPHIVMPAIHKTKKQLNELLHKNIGTELTDDMDKLTGFVCMILCNMYYTADIGLSSVNFAVTETGTLCLMGGDGKGRCG